MQAAVQVAVCCIVAAVAAAADNATHVADLTGGIAIRGNKFVSLRTGATVMLRGVSHSSGEFCCVQATEHRCLPEGRTAFEGQGGETAAAAQVIKSWGNNVVRVPVNEQCWLGINGVSVGGAAYQKAVKGFVDMITSAGMVVLLDLHWAAPGSTLATDQWTMPDRDHANDFWKSAAAAFKDDQMVVFELFNEPFPGSAPPSAPEQDWRCWATGGDCPGVKLSPDESNATAVKYQAAGMTELVASVRGTGAKNVILLGGIAWANDLDGWLDHAPADTLNNTGAVWHSYDFNACNNKECWDSVVTKVAEQVPVIVTESGFKISYVQKLWPWCESHGISYMAWVWNTWGSRSSLISDYNGTPTAYGKVWKAQLASAGSPWPPSP